MNKSTLQALIIKRYLEYGEKPKLPEYIDTQNNQEKEFFYLLYWISKYGYKCKKIIENIHTIRSYNHTIHRIEYKLYSSLGKQIADRVSSLLFPSHDSFDSSLHTKQRKYFG